MSIMLHITYNYALQTIQALSRKGYTASMVPPTTVCSASRVCSMSASRGCFPGSTIRTFIGILLIRSFFQRIFLPNGQQHDTCRRRKGNDHNSQQRETISCLREGLHLVRRNNRRGNRTGRRGCSGCRLRCGRVLAGRGFVYHLNQAFVSAYPSTMPCASFCSCPMAAFLAASAAASASAWLVNGPSCPESVLVLVLDTS